MNKASLTKSPQQISLIRDIDIVTILVFLSQGSHNSIGVENGVAIARRVTDAACVF